CTDGDVNFPVSREFGAETGLHPTASSGTAHMCVPCSFQVFWIRDHRFTAQAGTMAGAGRGRMPLKTAQCIPKHCVGRPKRVIAPTGCIERLPKGLSMGETGSVALLRPIFVVTHYRAGNLRTENLRNLYGVEGGTLTKVVASDKQSEPML